MPEADESRQRLGRYVAQRRQELNLSLSRAARLAGINRATWTGVERGTTDTEDYTLAAMEPVLGWAPRSAEKIKAGGTPTVVGRPRTAPAVGGAVSIDTLAAWAEAEIDEIWARKGLSVEEKRAMSARVRDRVADLMSVHDEVRRTA